MPKFEVSRTLVKSPPELWPELSEGRLAEAIGEAKVEVTEDERSVRWEAQGAQGSASLEPSGWGTKVTLSAEVGQEVARAGLWSRFRKRPPGTSPHADLEQRLHGLLDELGFDRRQPFSRE
ncbi:MAG TPA: hypothetical protein VK304_08800 [Thermoleophilaceae bacterium]|nr:hypothetical protein [Thermoleophilaceae bacterium]